MADDEAYASVVGRVAAIPLFLHIGEVPAEAHRGRIAAWDDWTGPEDAGAVAVIALRQQQLHDALVAEADEDAWSAALQRLVDHAAERLEAAIDQDAWHAPTSAAWQAAWVFCLEAAHRSRGLPVPDDIAAQVAWFERGHWPCALALGRDGRAPEDYVIF